MYVRNSSVPTGAFGLFALAALCGIPKAAQAIEPGESNPKKIMSAVEQRDTGDRMRGRMTLETRVGDERMVRVVRTTAVDVDDGTKTLMLFEKPADVRDTGLLIFDHDDGAVDDDQWLYLPSMRKTVRISGGDKSGSFMGTDFTYNDMTKLHVDQYEFRLLKQTTRVGDEPCWLIEATPTTKRARENSGYVKMELWVSKKKLMVVQSKAWVKKGKKLKYTKVGNIKKIDGVWIAHKVAVRVVSGKTVKSSTVLTLSGVELNNARVKASDFTQRRLEQGL